MTTLTQAPVPFFEDTRSLSEKLASEDREWRPHQPEHDCAAEIYQSQNEVGFPRRLRPGSRSLAA